MFLSPFVLFERLAAGANFLSFHRLLRLRLTAFTFWFFFLRPVFFRSFPLFPFVPVLVSFRLYPYFLPLLSLISFRSYLCFLPFLSLVSLASIRPLLFRCGLSLPLCLQLAVFIQSIIDARCCLSSFCSLCNALHFVPCLFPSAFPSKLTRS